MTTAEVIGGGGRVTDASQADRDDATHDLIRAEFAEARARLRLRWIGVALALIVSTAFGFAFALLVPPRYVATTAVVVSIQSVEGSQSPASAVLLARKTARSYADVASRPIVLDSVIRSLNLDVTAEDLASDVEANSPDSTATLQISVSAGSPALAAAEANAIRVRLSELVGTLSPTSPAGIAPFRFINVQTASPPQRPAGPSPFTLSALSAIFGAAIAIAIAIGRPRFRGRIRTVEDLVTLGESPLVGTLPHDGRAQDRPLVVLADPLAPLADAYRRLSLNLRFLDPFSGAGRYVLTSASSGDGTSTCAANLAIAAALGAPQARVLLVDANPQNSILTSFFNLEERGGLTDLVIGSATVESVLHATGHGQLHLLTAGSSVDSFDILLGSPRTASAVRTAAEGFDLTIVDAPAVRSNVDAALVDRLGSAAILVCDLGGARSSAFVHAVALLRRRGTSVVGVVARLTAKGTPRGGPTPTTGAASARSAGPVATVALDSPSEPGEPGRAGRSAP